MLEKKIKNKKPMLENRVFCTLSTGVYACKYMCLYNGKLMEIANNKCEGNMLQFANLGRNLEDCDY